MAGALVIFGLIAVLVAAIAWGYTQTVRARTGGEIDSSLDPTRAAQLVEQCFPAVLWRQHPGAGRINRRRRSMNDSGPVISIDITPIAGGGSHVNVWMSAWTAKAGVAFFSGSALGAVKRVLRRVGAASPAVVGQPSRTSAS